MARDEPVPNYRNAWLNGEQVKDVATPQALGDGQRTCLTYRRCAERGQYRIPNNNIDTLVTHFPKGWDVIEGRETPILAVQLFPDAARELARYGALPREFSDDAAALGRMLERVVVLETERGAYVDTLRRRLLDRVERCLEQCGTEALDDRCVAIADARRFVDLFLARRAALTRDHEEPAVFSTWLAGLGLEALRDWRGRARRKNDAPPSGARRRFLCFHADLP